MDRPPPQEHAPYYSLYIDRVPPGDLVDTLHRQGEATARLLAGVDEATADRAYAPGKWTLKEVVGHVVDVERVFATRALVIARGDTSPMPNLDEGIYVAGGRFGARRLASLIEEFTLLRASTLAFVRGVPADAWALRGTASGCEFTARCFPWIIAGHEGHHMQVIRERYLS